jgi:hypothetical protein
MSRILFALLGSLLLGWRVLPAQAPQDSLPPAKQAIEERYQQEREEGTRNPVPSNPSVPLPSVGESTFKLGLIEECDPFPARSFHTVNCWQGIVNSIQIVVYAGGRWMRVDPEGNEVVEQSPQQGMVVVDPRGEGQTESLPTPDRVGAVNIVAERNGTLILVSDTGRSYAFDVATRTFTALVSFKCPRSQGFWKSKATLWPVQSLTLGNDIYSRDELVEILRTPVGSKGGADASLILAHQLVAAKLNISEGSDPAPINRALLDADGLLIEFYNDKDKLPFRVQPSSTTGQAMVNQASALDDYNSGHLTPNCVP